MKYRKIKSIRVKLILMMSALFALTIFGVWIANQIFLPVYYQYSKVSRLAESFEKITSVVSGDESFLEGAGNRSLSEESLMTMEALAENGSMNTYLFQVNNFLGILQYEFYFPPSSSVTDGERHNVREKTLDYVLGIVDGTTAWNERELIKSKSDYQVFKVYDNRIGSYYLELFGQIETGDYIYISTNYQSMRENVTISNRFLLYIGLGAVVIAGFLLLLITESFTRPIHRMTEIAARMSKLDFDAKYPVTTEDEIGQLGNSINTLSERLEETISELKAANNELQRDIENKIQIDEMRKDFISNVSHELKTPIALIQGYAEGLHDNINDDSESREFYCDVIIDEANKMNKMVKKLLTLNQIEFGNSQLSFERFDITEMIRSVISSATLLAEQKEARIYMEDTDSIFVWADEYMVEEVVTNYISNAINHVDGEKIIRVSLERRERVVRVSVFNTGKQIPEDELDKIWIKFYKVDKARTRAYGGSGIGLSIVKAIISAMNQECGVRNHPDGVEFWFDVDIS